MKCNYKAYVGITKFPLLYPNMGSLQGFVKVVSYSDADKWSATCNFICRQNICKQNSQSGHTIANSYYIRLQSITS